MINRRSLATLVSVLAVGGLAVSGCGTSGPGAGGSSEPLSLEGSWTLVSGEGPEGAVEPVAGASITLVVDAEGAVSGSDGCNNLMGTVEVDGDAVAFSPLASTLMACEEAIMSAAYAYTQAVDGVTAGALEEGQLVLTGEGVELRYDAS